MPRDAREIANIILDRSEYLNLHISNLSLNKILYFVNGVNYKFTNEDLLMDRFEAWEYGPVIKEIYYQFKKHGSERITSRATTTDFLTGKTEIFPKTITSDELDRILPVIDFFSRVPSGKLVDWSHMEGSPWYETWHHAGRLNVGMKISNESMRAYFRSSWSKAGA
ncbi:MAG: DUF4065 domain-containing protein [Bosea sp.]|uniref:Panacea domain-containing protein n=1 Tax=Bosea sp. (in: a-proteobacteria) TaxID=1871050 RepID=UPI001ACDC11B|nr:type II toxin-antitoxin system antitoxin SocA domain-containing protein [Bosea sp. (in: a-proteobacteria)]MBN9451114.1 DUF4065 domain-containing protein [Bosea sp. (in: a-proteobacteria)]